MIDSRPKRTIWPTRADQERRYPHSSSLARNQILRRPIEISLPIYPEVEYGGAHVADGKQYPRDVRSVSN